MPGRQFNVYIFNVDFPRRYQWWLVLPSVHSTEPGTGPGSWATYLRHLCPMSLCKYCFNTQAIFVQNAKSVQACLNFNLHLPCLAGRTQSDLQRISFRADNFVEMSKIHILPCSVRPKVLTLHLKSC